MEGYAISQRRPQQILSLWSRVVPYQDRSTNRVPHRISMVAITNHFSVDYDNTITALTRYTNEDCSSQ